MKKYFSPLIVQALLLFIFLLPFYARCQTKNMSCADIKNGIFYFYPKNSAARYIETRDDEYLHEKNTVNGDTVLWQITWAKDCEYSVKFVSSNSKMTDEAAKFLQKHTLVYKIFTVTDEYYTFKGYVDKPSGNPIQDDTMWLNEKINIPDNQLFKRIPTPALLKRSHFGDTSKYAVLYIYRPGKFSNSMGNYLVYFDDNILCVAKNKSGYIFKILKEGQFEIKSRLLKDESSIKLDVKFGKIYYVKSMIHWTISRRLYNFKLDMAIMKPEQGETEFEDVDLQ